MANQNRRNGRSENSGAPRWVVFMGGMTTGIMVSLVAGAMLWPRSPATTGPAAQAAGATHVASPDKKNNDPVIYEYPKVLRETEVPIATAENGHAPAAADANANAPARVLFQVGAFRTHDEAESLRAQLVLLDVGQVSITEALLADGIVWHRVLIGPFANKAAADKALSMLAKQNISTLPRAAPADMPDVPPPHAPAAKPKAEASTGAEEHLVGATSNRKADTRTVADRSVH